MLYIDQPVGTTFSHAVIQNGTLNVANSSPPIFTPLQNNSSQLKTNATFMAATLDLRPLETTQTTTAQAAWTIWQFA